MNRLMLTAFGTFLFAVYFIPVATGGKAKILLESVNNKTSYKLNADILNEISQLQDPIKVISVVGNARVGKSTTLNLMSHILSEKSDSSVEEIFKTGNSFEAVTRNVWAHIIQPHNQSENGSILLLDVEGTDLGDDTVTDRLSMFTAMMSSSLNVLAMHIVGNGNIDFIYRIARLSDLVFKEQKHVHQNFPKLQIVIRTELDVPSDDHILDEIFKPKDPMKTQERGKIIQKYFPRESIAVSHIPTVSTVNDRNLLKDVKKLSKSDLKAFEGLAEKLKNYPQKRSFEGSPIDGTALVQLANMVVETINTDDSWKDFGDVWATIERDICRRSYEKHIGPILNQNSWTIGEIMIEAIDAFKKECALENEIDTVREELKITLTRKRKQEEEERRRQDEERRRRREEEENKRRQEEGNIWETVKTYATYFGFTALGVMISDENLKNNVTILPGSEYNHIGLRAACWEWNEDATKSFGLTGEGCGVIAQEVMKLYPWAVTEGKDGYLRVQYDLLRELVNVVRNKN